MSEQKREIINAINEIRKDLNLKPYPLEYLEDKSLGELRKLYFQYLQIGEDYAKKLKERKPKFKLNFKILLLILIPAVILLISILSFSGKVEESVIESTTSIGPVGNKSTNEIMTKTNVSQPYIPIYDFFIQSTFKDQTNNYVLIIQNNGTEDLIFQKILIDGTESNYKILFGSYPPLKKKDSIYLQLQKQCDNSTHIIKMVSENKTLEAELQSC